MYKIFSKFRIFCKSSLRVGWFLGWRQIRRSGKWATVLIIAVMTLTFLNLVFVSGILAGLVEGSSLAYRHQYSGDILLSTYESKNYISNSSSVVDIISSYQEVIAYTPRILSGTVVEANYRNKKSIKDNTDSVSAVIAGINPIFEDSVTNLRDLVIDGDYLDVNDQDEILIGSNLLSEYSRDVPGDETLENVKVGDKIRLNFSGLVKEVTVKGVVKSKIGEVGQRLYINDNYLSKLISRPSQNVNEISILLEDGIDPYIIKNSLRDSQVCDCAKIETWEESQGQFFKDISRTFNLLGLMIGSIGIAVATITVFIVIFINAITRKRYIGILKGIGICGGAIQISYIIQSLFYSAIGSCLGTLILFGVLKPYIDRNPIDFPFSDGILVAPIDETIIKIIILVVATILAGYVPARIIVKKNTLDSILGR